MFDKQAKRSLERGIAGDKQVRVFNHRHYIGAYMAFFKSNAARIDEASRAVGRKYPYPTRVADKWLWLNGLSSDPHEAERLKLKILTRFAAGLASATLVGFDIPVQD